MGYTVMWKENRRNPQRHYAAAIPPLATNFRRMPFFFRSSGKSPDISR
jgi:hypothetical protein